MAIQTLQSSAVPTIIVVLWLLCAGTIIVQLDAASVAKDQTLRFQLAVAQSEDVIVARGHATWLHCAPSSPSVRPYDVRWLFNDEPIDVDDDKWQPNPNGTLFIPKVAGRRLNGSSLDGVFRCLVRVDDGTLRSRPIKLSLALMKNFNNQPKDLIKVDWNQSVILPCSINSTPMAIIQWEFNNRPIYSNPQSIYLPSGALLLQNVNTSHSGTYQCRATNAVLNKTKMSTAGRLHVNMKQRPTSSNQQQFQQPPKILTNEVQLNQSARVGDAVTFYCIVNGSPAPTIRWLNEMYVMLSNSSVLSLRNVSVANSGRFTCTAYNSGGLVEQHFYLNVTQSPTFNVTPVSKLYPIAQSIRLDCQATGVPSPSITWYKNGELFDVDSMNGRAQLLPNNGLLISHSKLSDAGIYQCVATNPTASISAAALIKFNFTKNSPDVPTNLRCLPFNDTGLCLKWNKVANAQAYSVAAYYPGSPFKDYVTNVTYTFVDKMEPHRNYTFAIRAYSNEASNELASIVCATSEPGLRNLTIIQANDATVTLTWRALTTDLSHPCHDGDDTTHEYMIRWRRVGDASGSISSQHVIGFTYVVRGLQPLSSYEFQVQPYSSFISTSSTSWKRFDLIATNSTTSSGEEEEYDDDAVPKPPVQLSVRIRSPHELEITWLDDLNPANLTQYYVLCIRNNTLLSSSSSSDDLLSKECALQERAVGCCSYTATNLRANHIYEFRVRAHYSDVLFSAYSYGVQVTTPSDVPSPVRSLKYRVMNTTCVCIGWEPPQQRNGRLLGYAIKYTPNDSWPLDRWLVRNFTAAVSQNCWGTSMSILLNNLDVNLEYLLVVIPFNKAGDGNPSRPITISTKHAHLQSEMMDLDGVEDGDGGEEANDERYNSYYRQGIGVALGFAFSILLILLFVGCFLLRIKYLKRRRKRNNHHQHRNNIFNATTTTTTNPSLHQHHHHHLRHDARDESNGDVHEMQQLVAVNNTIVHLDSKGGGGVRNGGVIHKQRPNGNAVVSADAVRITDNPHHYYRKRTNSFEEDSNSNLKRIHATSSSPPSSSSLLNVTAVTLVDHNDDDDETIPNG